MTVTSPSEAASAGPPTGGRWHLAGALGWDGAPETTGALVLAVEDGCFAGLHDRGPAAAGPAGLVLVPLLINGHDHGRGHGNVVAGIADAPLEEWLAGLRSAPLVAQSELVGAAGAEMARSGVGAAVLCVNPQRDDVASEVEAAASAAASAGMRAAIVYPIADSAGDAYGRSRDATGWSEAETAARLASFEDLARRLSRPGVELQLGPVGPQWVSAGTLRAVADHARARGRRIHMHLLESRAQRAWADRTYPEGVVAWLGSIGILGPHLCVAHGTHLTGAEQAELAAAGAVLTMNPSSNLRLASGIPPVAAALDGDGLVACGLDGLALGDDQDYWTELRLLKGLSQAQSGMHPDAGGLLARLLAGGRRALGSAAPDVPATGRLADFALIDLGRYRHLWTDRGWSLASVVMAAARPDLVSEVWVAGRPLYRAGNHWTTWEGER